MSTDRLRITHATHEDLKPSQTEADVLETMITFHASDGSTEEVKFSFGPGYVALGHDRCAQRLADYVSERTRQFNETGSWSWGGKQA